MLHIITYSNELTVDTGTLYNPGTLHIITYSNELTVDTGTLYSGRKAKGGGECVCGLGGGGGSKTG